MATTRDVTKCSYSMCVSKKSHSNEVCENIVDKSEIAYESELRVNVNVD